MLASGCLYMDIIRYLNSQGFPGFNKVNLNAWKKTGFQAWLQTQTASGGAQAILEAVQKPLEADTHR